MLAKSVNMFTGCVGFQESLVNLPGSPGKEEFGVRVVALYQSNLQLQAAAWNLDAPTGILGLGWSIPRERIVASTSGSAGAGAFSYALETNGVTNPLIQDNLPWTLLTLSSGDLMTGTVTAELIAGFAAAGIVLDASAQVSAVAGSGFVIADPVWQRLYGVDSSTGTVTDGGISFQLQNFEFWRIFYYPDYKRWQITTDSGEVRSYGGIGTPPTGVTFAVGVNNSIEWAVGWLMGTSEPASAWSGSSSQCTSVQYQYPVAWNLASRRDRFGATITYLYNDFPRDPDTEIITNGAEQLVGGSSGLPYTKACYLSCITDMFGRTLTFNYQPKTCTAACQEYMDPHKDLLSVAATTPNAYQDRYETLYLASIDVASPQAPLFSLSFSYALADLTVPSTGATGMKRFLTGIAEANGYGQTLPGRSYSYQTTAGASNAGAMLSATYPQGGTATWTYSSTALEVCDRQLVVTAPTGNNLTAPLHPTVWFGPDYVVTLWIDNVGNMVVSVYTWIGQWVGNPVATSVFTPSSGTGVLTATLQAQVNTDCFAILFTVQSESASSTQVVLGARNPSLPAEWSMQTDTATLPAPIVSLTGGTGFVAATATDNSGTCRLYLWTWSWQTAGWSSVATAQTGPTSVIGQNEYFLVATSGSGTVDVALNWLDGGGSWHQGWTTTLTATLGDNDQAAMRWAAGPSTVALVFATSFSVTSDHTVFLMNWSADYATVNVVSVTVAPEAADEIPTEHPPQPIMSADGFVGVRNALFRFDGVQWNQQNLTGEPKPSNWLTYAYGTDVAVQAVSGNLGLTTVVYAFDPNAGSFGEVQALSATNAQTGGAQNGWPSAFGGDCLVVGNELYFRQTATDWSDATGLYAFPTYPAQTGSYYCDSTSIVDQAPSFFAVQCPNDTDATQDSVIPLVLQNGQAVAGNALSGTRFSYGSNITCAAWGPDTLVTWSADDSSFWDAQSFTLNRYAAQALIGTITVCPVSQLDITDGFGNTLSTAYEFDGSTAACDPTGSFFKYYNSRAYSGTDEPLSAANGFTAYQYINGYDGPTSNIMTDGLKALTVDFAGTAPFSVAASTGLTMPTNTVPTALSQLPDTLSEQLASVFSSNGIALPDSALVWRATVGKLSYVAVADGDTSYAILDDFAPANAGGFIVFAGQPVRSTSIQWDLFTTRSNGGTEALPLHGGFARPTGTVSIEDGCERTASFTYTPSTLTAPLTGGKVTTTTSYVTYESSQVGIVQTETATALASVSAAAYAANLLQPVAGLIHEVQVGTGSAVTTSSVATTWKGWQPWGSAGPTVLAPDVHWAWSGDPSGNDTGVFPLDGTPSSFWLPVSTVVAISADGLIAERDDQNGTRESVLYSADGQAQIARVLNASFLGGTCLFTSFESYETLSGWNLGGTGLDAATGWATAAGHGSAQCLTLAAGQTLAAPVLAPDASRILVFTVQVNTPSGYDGAGGSGCVFTVKVDGTAIAATIPTLSFPDTGGRWQRVTQPIDLPALVPDPSGTVTLEITAANADGASAAVMIDTVVAVPLCTSFAGRTYNPAAMLPLAHVDAAGRAALTMRDPFLRGVAGTNIEGEATSLHLRYLSLQGNSGGFSATDPNVDISLRAPGGGFCQTFLDAQAWTEHWTPDSADAFAASGGVLVHADASQTNTLTSAASVSGSFAFYGETVPAPSGPLLPTDALTLTAGTAVMTIATTGTWTVTLDNQTVTPLATTTLPLLNWLVLSVDGCLTLFANGQVVASTAASVTGFLAVTTGGNAIAFSNLAVLLEPSLAIDYSDATGKTVQNQALMDGTYVAGQTIYDACGQVIVRTKSMPALALSGASLAVPAYRPGLVGTPAFPTGLDGTATLSGDLTTWYNGASDTTVADDDGYPYTRTLHEPSPLARPVEIGLPGAALAIINPGTTTASARQTYQRAYGIAASAVPYLGLQPAVGGSAGFLVDESIDPLKNVIGKAADASRVPFGRWAQPASGTAALTTGTRSWPPGESTLTRIDPNTYQASQTTASATMVSNALRQSLTDTTVDGGSYAYLYDTGGKLRLCQHPDGTVTYSVWDALGRQTSEGILQATWDPATLQPLLADPAWPLDQGSYPITPLRAWIWDGDGTDPNSIGHVVEASAMTPASGGAGPFLVVETITYTPSGRPASRTVSVTAAGETIASYRFGFTYDALGRLVQLDYPKVDGVALTSVTYSCDGADRIVGIADQTGASIAAYTYNALGLPVTDTLAGGVIVSRSFDSLSRLDTQTVTQGGTTLFTCQLGYALDGLVDSLWESLNSTEASYAADVSYSYDGLKRLTAATDADNARTLSISYTDASGNTDLNGNIQQMTVGTGLAQTFAYVSGTNQLASVTPEGGTATTYGCTNGIVTSVSGGASMTLGVVPGTMLPSTITAGDATLSFGYDSLGDRVVKQGPAGTAIRITDFSGLPLLTRDETGAVTFWVGGPMAQPAAIAGASGTQAVVLDYLRTPRLVFGASGVLAAYAYDALGQSVCAQEPSPNYLPYGFTLQEWDSETGLYNFRARLYDPAIGRFLAPDPAEELPSSYVYAAGRPTMLTDPSGMMSSAGETAIDIGLLAVILATAYVTDGLSETYTGAAQRALIGAVSGSVETGAASGISYNMATPPGQWSAGDFGRSVGTGALAGAVTGGVMGVAQRWADTRFVKGDMYNPVDLNAYAKAVAEKEPEAAMPAEPKPKRFIKTSDLVRRFGYRAVGNVLHNAATTALQDGFKNLFEGDGFTFDRTAFITLGNVEKDVLIAFGSTAAESQVGAYLKIRAKNELKSGFRKVSGLSLARQTTIGLIAGSAVAGTFFGLVALNSYWHDRPSG